jgi:hypothetical protein
VGKADTIVGGDEDLLVLEPEGDSYSLGNAVSGDAGTGKLGIALSYDWDRGMA